MRRGFPSFLGTTTIRMHHSVGSPTGTFWRIPISTSFSNCIFTSSFQWCGTGMGEWAAYGVALSIMCNFWGFPDIGGNGCDVISKVDLENWSINHDSSLCMFSSIGSNGSVAGRSGSNLARLLVVVLTALIVLLILTFGKFG